MVDNQVPVPRYVLNLDNVHAGPRLVPQLPGVPATVIYGFTAKAKFDAYLQACHSHTVLTPYPLVKGYMLGLINSGTSGLTLVAIDATGPHQSSLYAVTMESIVAAIDQREDTVRISHMLTRNDSGDGYGLTDMPAELMLNP